MVPFGICYAHPSDSNYLMAIVLEMTFFVNAAGLFMLSALIEKQQSVIVHPSNSILDCLFLKERENECQNATCPD